MPKPSSPQQEPPPMNEPAATHPLYLEPVDDGLPVRETGPWTAEKLDYLRRYMAMFTVGMHHKAFRALHYVDLFAGPGKCRIRDTGDILLGSPILALQADRPFDRYYLSDFDQGSIRALDQRCRASPLAQRVSSRVGDANVLVHEVVQEIADIDAPYRNGVWPSLNLAFLDPEGLELQWATVEALGSARRMDLIINYSEGGLNRYMPEAISHDDGTAVDRFFGDRLWRAIYSDPRPRIDLHRRLLDHYKAKLEKLGYADVQSTEEPLIRNEQKNAPLYRLLFASKHAMGNKFWRQVLKRDVYGQTRLLESNLPY